MKKQMLWRGQWVDEAELERKVRGLAQALPQDLNLLLDTRVVVQAANAVSEQLRSSPPQELISALQEQGESKEQALDTCRILAKHLTKPALEKKLMREFGTIRPQSLRVVNYRDTVYESWEPLGVMVHIAPGNASTVAPLTTVDGLLSGNINLLRVSTREGPFAARLLKALVDADPSQTLAPFIYAFSLSSSRTDVLRELFSVADGVSAWGGEAALASIRDLTPPHARLVEWGHKLSFAYLTPKAAKDPDVLRGVAKDVCEVDQQACSSPQCLFVDTSDPKELESVAEALFSVMEEVSPQYPQAELSPEEEAELTTVTALARTDESQGEAKVLSAGDGSFRLIVDQKKGLTPSPLFRTLWVRPLSGGDIVATLHPLRAWLQTAGLGCAIEELPSLSRALLRGGVTCIKQPGTMTSGYEGEPHDGVYALPRYSRRVAMVWDDTARRIGDFSAFESRPEPAFLKGHPILSKDGFQQMQVDDNDYRLIVQSGGSSGVPKVSRFSYTDLWRQMTGSADGYLASGMDPRTDRCVNLLYAGQMYGGFISEFMLEEIMDCVQLPMGCIEDTEFVAKTIIQHRATLINGMGSYVVRLLTEQEKLLKEYGGLKKVFYGGEHLAQEQKERLKSEFGLELFTSAVYGSSDGGPTGYACEHCPPNVFHPMEFKHIEIVQMDEDAPVKPGDTGRLLVTCFARTGQNLTRYDIGDLARWMPDPCPCGRKLPRFELMGRHGDVFRLADSELMNFNLFPKLLAEELSYRHLFQMVIETRGDITTLTARIDQASGLHPEAVRALFLERVPALTEVVEGYHETLKFEVHAVPQDAFETTRASGKVRTLIDRRLGE